MVRPCYVYLKLKMPGPKGTIMVDGNLKHSLKCDVASIDIVESQITATELDELKKSVDTKPARSSKKSPLSSTFQPTQDTKKV